MTAKIHNEINPTELLNRIDINDYEQLHQVFDCLSLTFPISITDKNGVITKVNNKFCESTGFSEKELIGRTHNIISHQDTTLSEYENMWHSISNKEDYCEIMKIKCKSGKALWHFILIRPVLDKNGEIDSYFSFRVDMSDFMNMKRKLEISSQLDKKTNLYKKSKLLYKMKDSKEGVLFTVGIKSFSTYKSFFGEEFADKLLLEFAKRLEKYYFLHFSCYSLEDDNLFAIYRPLRDKEFVDKALIKKVTLDSKESLLAPFIINGTEFSIDICIGVSNGPNEDLIHNSRVAYESATKRNLELLYYEEGMNTKLKLFKKNLEFVNEILYAIKHDGIILHYQPILDLKENKINKYECLVRMKNRAGTITVPNAFLPIAKTAGCYSKITKIVIEKAFDFFEDKDHYFSINVSYEDIKREDFVDFLINKLRNYNGSNRVIVEILEDEDVMQTIDDANRVFEEIKKTGAKVAIDDFGVGYSNIDNLLSMNIDIIKIDGKIIKNILEDNGTYEMIEGVVKMAHKKGIKVIGEYVESEEILNVLINMGIDGGQGYHIGKPSAQLVE